MPGRDYYRWFYESGVWKRMHYRGVRILKVPSDLWNYQEIFTERRVQWVVETGTRHGGSALFFADLLAMGGSPGKVISIDVDASSNLVSGHPGITFLHGDSSSTEMAERVGNILPENRGTLFVILDSDHTKSHVLREFNAYLPLLRPGDYLVVEDTCINGHPVRAEFGPGPYEAVADFLAAHPGMFMIDREREAKFGFTASPNGYPVRV